MHSDSYSSKSLYSKNNDENMPETISEDSLPFTKEPLWYLWTKKASTRDIQMQQSRRSARSFDAPSKRWGHSASLYNKIMIIFGGRHSTRSLANLYTLDLETLLWSKLEPLGQIPPARDSHSCIVVSKEIFI
jgi:hypothetical protein